MKDVSSKGNHTGIINCQGELFLLGESLLGKLGRSVGESRNISVPLKFPSEEKIREIVCSDGFSLALKESGEVWSWGGTLHKKGGKSIQPERIERLLPYVVRQISCGIYHSVCVSEEGMVFSWGGGGHDYNLGQLGHGNFLN